MIKTVYALLLCGLLSSALSAHPGAINLYVDTETGQIYPFQPFAPARLGLFAGIEISAQFPGFGVSFPSNGVEVGQSLELKTTLGLMYWDGNGIAQATPTMNVIAPDFDNDGNQNMSPVSDYFIDASSINLSGLIWGTYSGSSFWEADSLYFLNPLDAPTGIYGLSVQIDSPDHDISDPFLFPFVYDPFEEFDEEQEAAGLLKLKQTVLADNNFDGVLDCLDVDALVAEIVGPIDSNNSGQFDLNEDGIVDTGDLDVWLEVAGGHNRGSGFQVGDANLDGQIDGVDFIAWNTHKFGTEKGWCQGDFNADGFINGVDFVGWNGNKFSTSDVAAVPEPGSRPLCWAICGFFAVFFRVRS